MVTFSTKKKRITVGEHTVIDQEAIYACVIGLLVSQRYLSFQEVLATELTAYPPSIFHADGQMRDAIHGTVATFISGFKMWLSLQLSEADVYVF